MNQQGRGLNPLPTPPHPTSPAPLHLSPSARQVITASLQARQPCMFFCKLGKDRTGLMAALVLAACGLSEDEIVADYVRWVACGSRGAAVGSFNRTSLMPRCAVPLPHLPARNPVLTARTQAGTHPPTATLPPPCLATRSSAPTAWTRWRWAALKLTPPSTAFFSVCPMQLRRRA